MLRTDLGADPASGAQGRIDFDSVGLNIKRRAAQVIDAVSVIFAPVADLKRFAS